MKLENSGGDKSKWQVEVASRSCKSKGQVERDKSKGQVERDKSKGQVKGTNQSGK